jgi:polysaccharide biosynthesis protein PslG
MGAGYRRARTNPYHRPLGPRPGTRRGPEPGFARAEHAGSEPGGLRSRAGAAPTLPAYGVRVLACLVLTVVLAPLPWYVALHAEEFDRDLTRGAEVLDLAVELGAAGVRTDVSWFDLEPERDRWDDDALEFYAGYVELARERDLDPLLILSRAPGWARELYQRDPAAFFLEYEDYVRRVVARLGPLVDRWQLWNEANHPVDFVRGDDDWELFARAGAVVRERDPDAETLINVYADVPGWQRALTQWLERAGELVDVVGVDHYPGTWSLASSTRWGPLRALVRRAGDPDDPLHGKRLAVLETGFSAWLPRIADEDDQRRWVARALPALHDLVREVHERRPGLVALACYYQLVDAPDRALQEGGFGVLRGDLSPKPAAAALREAIREE